MREKKPLYRKVNTKARGVHHHSGHYRWSRNAKAANRSREGSMRSKQQRGLDYTPLFRFLLSKVGEDWDAVHSEAVSRLDREDPIFWMVALSENDRKAYVCIGDYSYYSGLYVDEDNRLALVDPDLRVEDMEPLCAGSTHSFNGVPFTRKYRR